MRRNSHCSSLYKALVGFDTGHTVSILDGNTRAVGGLDFQKNRDNHKKNGELRMNRALAVIFSLLLLWAGTAYGFSGVCCCARDADSSMECTDSDAAAIRDPSCNHGGPCNGWGCESRFSFQCVREFKPLPVSEFESSRSEGQIFALPVALFDVQEFLQELHPIHGQPHSFFLNLTDRFLETCSFLC